MTVPTFALAAGANTVAFTNTYTPPKEEPPAASLKITNTISAPQARRSPKRQLAYSGSCPSAFTTAALAGGGTRDAHASPAPSRARAARSPRPRPAAAGWKTTVSVNGAAPVELDASGGKLTAPTFALAAGANTVAFTNTYTPPTEEGTVPKIPDPSAGGWQLNGNAAARRRRTSS